MGIEIRKDPYIIKKGIRYSDQSEQELISYEGKTHTAENIDNQSLTLKVMPLKIRSQLIKNSLNT